MCWIGKDSDIHIAKEDIKCKKVLMKDKLSHKLYAPFRCTNYEIGNTYHQLFDKKELEPKEFGHYEGNVFINIGIHCYTHDKKMVQSELGKKRLYAGLAYYEPSRNFTPVIVECVIPKNTCYCENAEGEIVTEELIILEECSL